MLEALQRSNIEGLPAYCDGGDPETPPHIKPFDFYAYGPMCTDCLVTVAMKWNNKIPMSSVEHENLTGHSEYVNHNSRLACCIQIEEWMDGMTVEIGLNVT